MSTVIRVGGKCTRCKDVGDFGVEVDGFGEHGDDLAFRDTFAVVWKDVVV